MILGFLIAGNQRFITFEHYFENFSQYIKDKNDFFDFLDSSNYRPGHYEYDLVSVLIEALDDKHLIGIIYLTNKLMPKEYLDQISRIASQVVIADKEITHEVLKSRYASDLLQ